MKPKGRQFAAVTAVALAVAPASAEVRLEGNADALRLEASDATVAEVLNRFADTYKVKMDFPEALDRDFDGTYSGSLTQVIGKVLEQAKYNYVIKLSPAGTELVVLGNAPADDAKTEPPKRTRVRHRPLRPNAPVVKAPDQRKAIRSGDD